jgi:hypothetical protein
MDGISLGDLTQLFNQAFPILPGVPGNNPKQALRQFSAEEVGPIQITRSPCPLWAQGDILDPITFPIWPDEGTPRYFEAPGMIMNSTCDLDRKDNVVLCPCLRLDDFKGLSSYEDIPKNTIFDFFFIGKCIDSTEWAVDLSRPVTLPRERIQARLEEGLVHRLHSLTQKGWYLFITKFAMKYLRSDDLDTMKQR